MKLSESMNNYVDGLWDSIETQKTYRVCLRLFLKFMVSKFGEDVTTKSLYDNVLVDFDTKMGKAGLKNPSRKTYVAVVRSWLATASMNRELPRSFDADIARIIHKKRKKRSSTSLPDLEAISHVPELVDYFNNAPIPPIGARGQKMERMVALRNRALVMLLYATMCRQGEARKLKRKDMQEGFATQIKIVGKGDQSDILIFEQEEARKAMQEYLAERDDSSPYTFISHQNNSGKPLSSVMMWKIVHEEAEKMGLNLSPHKLRHFGATYMLNEGVPVDVIQKKLRHKRISTTVDTYAKTDIRNVIEWSKNVPLPMSK